MMYLEKSRVLYDKAVKKIPGGASSSLRGYPFYDPYPIFIEKGDGSKVTDVDGNEYIDYNCAFGAIILGHCHPTVTDAVRQQLEKGTMFGTVHELEIKVAEKINKMVPSVEMLRFACSGTEATMTALRIARGYTGKDKIIKFEGHYHGHCDYTLLGQSAASDCGSRISPNKIPMSPGIPEEILKTMVILPWNDLDVVEKAVKRSGNEIAGIITEPIMGNGGMIYPQEGYLEGLREIASENDIVLIFDEVWAGFRVAKGGTAEFFGVVPDLHTFAKAMANGYPIAAFGGKKEIMENVGAGKIFHGGTYAANPLSLAASLATLNELDNTSLYKEFYKLGDNLILGLREAAEKTGHDIHIPGFAGFYNLFFTAKKEFRDWRDIEPNVDKAKYEKWSWEMYRRGIYHSTPESFERVNLTMAHTEEDIEKTIDIAEEAFKAI
jgi:glutamate-1-semialdehyde 2,1-aminomutase